MTITFKGKPITLRGSMLKPGDKLPDFALCNPELNPVRRDDLKGLKVFAVVPSLDTGVCDLEVKAFNQKAAALPGVTIYAISLDLPFAQARWCGANGIAAVKTLSDYRDRSFGLATGTFIEELALLARAVFIVDDANTIVYAEYVPEISAPPAYDTIYAKLDALTK